MMTVIIILMMNDEELRIIMMVGFHCCEVCFNDKTLEGNFLIMLYFLFLDLLKHITFEFACNQSSDTLVMFMTFVQN